MHSETSPAPSGRGRAPRALSGETVRVSLDGATAGGARTTAGEAIAAMALVVVTIADGTSVTVGTVVGP